MYCLLDFTNLYRIYHIPNRQTQTSTLVLLHTPIIIVGYQSDNFAIGHDRSQWLADKGLEKAGILAAVTFLLGSMILNS